MCKYVDISVQETNDDMKRDSRNYNIGSLMIFLWGILVTSNVAQYNICFLDFIINRLTDHDFQKDLVLLTSYCLATL